MDFSIQTELENQLKTRANLAFMKFCEKVYKDLVDSCPNGYHFLFEHFNPLFNADGEGSLMEDFKTLYTQHEMEQIIDKLLERTKK